jgi:RNA polymerase sigma factor (sigma-70 family)
MANGLLTGVLRHLRRATLLSEGAAQTDGDLLERYLTERDEAAFEALLVRHGAMVLGVCRRILRNEADAQDAFQATFVVFLRKASSIQPRAMVGNWLYGVAHRTSLKAKAMNRRRGAREVCGTAESRDDSREQELLELQALLDQELSRLPDRYRAPVILCELEGKSIRETAQRLGCPPGTVASRLARGRDMLARRLARLGLSLPAGALVLALEREAAAAGVPSSLFAATVRSMTALAAGQTATAAVISTKALTLAEGVMKTMLLTKMKLVVLSLTVCALLGTAGTQAVFHAMGAEQEERGKAPPPVSEPAKKPRPETDGAVLLRQGKLDEAAASFRRAIQIDPRDAQAYNNLGIVLLRQGKLVEAIDCFRRAIELDPKLTQAHYNLGNALHQQGKLDEAVACFRRAIQLDPRDAQAHNNLGNVLLQQGKMDEAVASLRRSIELDPRNASVHNNLGNVLSRQGKLEEAVACFRRALELNPKLTQPHDNLGNALLTQGKAEEAAACFRRSIELDPRNALAHNNLGVVLLQQGKMAEAVACSRRAIELDPKLAQAYSNLGNALMMQGKLAEAAASQRRAIELDPKLARLQGKTDGPAEQKKLEQVVASSRQAIQLNPNDVPAHVNLGKALVGLKKLDDAVATLRRAIQLDPKYAEAHYNLGTALKQQGKLTEAEASHRRAIELDPKLARPQGNGR